MPIKDSQIPPQDIEQGVLRFCQDAIEEGEAFLKAQPGFDKIQDAMDAIMGQNTSDLLKPSALSKTSSNHIGKISEDLSALLTDIKPFWEYRTSNPNYQPQAVGFGKLSTHWYLNRQIDLALADAIKYVLVGGSSYCNLHYDSEIDDIKMEAEDPRDVFPIRPPSNSCSIQEAMGVVVRRQRTMNYLRTRYPKSQWHKIKADGYASWVDNFLNTRAGQFLKETVSPFAPQLFPGDDTKRKIPRVPTCDFFTIYLKDDTRNETGRPVLIGEADEQGIPYNWSDIVQPGQKLYPRGRMIECTRYGVLRDGPNPYWHGMFPLPKLTLVPFPWTWLGKAPLWDLIPLQKSLDCDLRIIDDYLAKLARPDVLADKNVVSRSTLDKWDTRKAGGKYLYNARAALGSKSPVDVVYPQQIDASVYKHLEFIINEMDNLSGVRDLSQLMRLNQVPGADTIEKISQSMTASVRGRSRVLEAFMREFAIMMAYNFAQFRTMPERLLILGPQGLTKEDFDFDPGTIIPDYIHGEDFNDYGMPSVDAQARGPRPKQERTREFMRQFTFHIAPGSLLSASEIEKKLLYLQLARAGWMDMETLLEELGIPNITQIKERLAEQNAMGMGMQASAAGRKATGQTMPRMVIKES